MRVVNLTQTSHKELLGICPAIYVAKNENKGHTKQYTFGSVGIRSANSSFEHRFKEHEKDKTDVFDDDGKQLYRHKASPWRRFWATDLTGWSPKGAGLAEWLLYATVAGSFRLVDQSCFEADGERLVFKMLDDVVVRLQVIEARGNHTWTGSGSGYNG